MSDSTETDTATDEDQTDDSSAEREESTSESSGESEASETESDGDSEARSKDSASEAEDKDCGADDDSADESDDEDDDSDDESGSGSDGESDEDGTRLTKEQAMGNEDVPEDKQKAIEEERQERLDPDNRPEGAQIDNSDREFDMGTGQFTDHETDEEIGPYNDPSAPDGEIEA